ncbi:uncharacterized protein [Nicotiana tomentosiformis]|uniref:uncharacterized protein n=1 Tax=Nicotiana tomentosiformis TaxID=4098 RepID=UPI00051C3DE5|nr:uncharacterized protein LOC104107315 [Nicotiana tomentosiformis]
MPSFSLQLTPGISQLTSSAPLLITGTTITRQECDQYFPGPPEPSTVADDRPVRDVESGRRLSYGSSSRDAEDLSQDLASSSAVTEATLCDTDMPETDDYTQEPAETMVTAGPTDPSTEPASIY